MRKYLYLNSDSDWCETFNYFFNYLENYTIIILLILKYINIKNIINFLDKKIEKFISYIKMFCQL